MKNKLMAILTLIAVAAMILTAPAVKASSKTYKVLDEVNFYAYEGDSVGTTTFILETADKGTNTHIRTLMVGYALMPTNNVYCDLADGDCSVFTNTAAYKDLLSSLESTHKGLDGHAKNINEAGNLTFLTLNDVKTIFGATSADNGVTYTIDVAKYGKIFEYVSPTEFDGMFLQADETSLAQGNTWIIEFTKNGSTITGLTVKQVAMDGSDTMGKSIAAVPVTFMDKTYDCHYTQTEDNYMCYICGEEQDDYQWVKEGTDVDTTCTAHPELTQTDCAENPVTGVEEYILPVTLIVCAAAVILTIVAKKDVLKKI